MKLHWNAVYQSCNFINTQCPHNVNKYSTEMIYDCDYVLTLGKMACGRRKDMTGWENMAESAKFRFPGLYVTITLCDIITEDIGKGTLLLKLA